MHLLNGLDSESWTVNQASPSKYLANDPVDNHLFVIVCKFLFLTGTGRATNCGPFHQGPQSVLSSQSITFQHQFLMSLFKPPPMITDGKSGNRNDR